MATLAVAPRGRPAADRRFFGGAALVMLAATFIGFAPSYYLSSYYPDARALPAVVHVHGIVFTAWMLLYTAQTALIATGRRDLHRMLGTGAIALAAAMLVVGVQTAIWVTRHGSNVPHKDPLAFLINPLTAILLFGGFVAAGVAMRTRADHHKRLMLLATLSIVQTPLARIARMADFPVPPIGGMILSDLVLAALVAFDLRTRARLHPVTLWMGGLLLATQPLRVIVGGTDAWHAVAAALVA